MGNWYYPEFKSGINCIITAFKTKLENNFNFMGELHNFWELVYVTEGSLFVSEDSRIYELFEGDIIFHKPMEFHKIWVEKDQSARAIIMSFESDDENIKELSQGVFKLDAEKQNTIEEIFRMIDEHFNLNFFITKKENSDTIAEKLTFMNFEVFLLSVLSAKNSSRGRKFNASAMNYKMIIDTMNEHISENLSIDELAALCDLSVSNLKKIFSKYAGGGVMKHFNRLKIKKAMKLLRLGLSVADTSYKLGFSSQNYFSVVFRRETGVLPSDYRQAENTEARKTNDHTEE